MNILITGLPRSGKTTLINKILKDTKIDAIGFITNEVKSEGKRIGFSIETLSGIKLPLAAKSNKVSRYRVASYGVYLENIDIIVEQLQGELKENNRGFIVIDEIGKMELFSKNFTYFLDFCLNQQRVLGTIMLKDNAYTRKIKQRPDTKVFHLSVNNRETIEKKILEMLN